MLLEGVEEKYEIHVKDIIENATSFKLPRENRISVLVVETTELTIRLYSEKLVPLTCTPAWLEEAIILFYYLI
jgi:hypothetical protein